MKIAVISHSHGSLAAWEKAEKYFAGTDMVLHAGDILYYGARNPLPAGYNTIALTERINEAVGKSYNLLAVQGNVDSLVDTGCRLTRFLVMPFMNIMVSGLSCIMDISMRLLRRGLLLPAALGLASSISAISTFHFLEERDNVILLNPGSISLPKQEPAVPSMAIIDDSEIRIFNLDTGETLYSLER